MKEKGKCKCEGEKRSLWKDLFVVVVTVVCNTAALMFFQPTVQSNIQEAMIKLELRATVYQEFWDNSREFNNSLINANVQTQRNPETIMDSLYMLQNQEIILEQYYDSNLFDLEIFDKEFKAFTEAWYTFSDLIEQTEGNFSDYEQELGTALQDVKDRNAELCIAIRESI